MNLHAWVSLPLLLAMTWPGTGVAESTETTPEQAFETLRAELDAAYRSFPNNPTARTLVEDAAAAAFQVRLGRALVPVETLQASFRQLIDRLAVCQLYPSPQRDSARRWLLTAAQDLHSRALATAIDPDERISLFEAYDRLMDHLRLIRGRFVEPEDLRRVAESAASEIFNRRLSFATLPAETDYAAQVSYRIKLLDREFGPATEEERLEHPSRAAAKDRNRNAYEVGRSALQTLLNRIVQEAQ